MKYLKFALFALCVAIVSAIVASIIQMRVIYSFSILGGSACVGSLIIWLCTKISKRFNHSANVIVIIAFAAAGIYCYAFAPSKIAITSIKDIYSLDIFSIIVLISILGVSISLLVLIWKLIFQKKDLQENIPEEKITNGIDQ